MASSVLLISGLSFLCYDFVFQEFGIETIANVTDMKMERARHGVDYRFFYSYLDLNGVVYQGNAVPFGENQDTIFVTDKMKIRYMKFYPQYSSGATDALNFGLIQTCIGATLLLIGIFLLKQHKLPNGKYDT